MALVEPLPGNRLYHYTSLDTFQKYILPEMQLLLNPIAKTNDPRENKGFRFNHTSQGGIGIIEKLHQLDKEYSSLIREDCKVICFTDDFRHRFGHNLSNMWAHYANKHIGVCILLNKYEFIAENFDKYNFDLLGKVEYYNFNPTMEYPENLTIDHIEMNRLGKNEYLKSKFRIENMKYLFFTKNFEWQTENEIRLLHFSKSIEQNEYCSIKKSLREIHFGIEVSEEIVRSIKSSLNNSSLKFYIKQHENVGLIHKLVE